MGDTMLRFRRPDGVSAETLLDALRAEAGVVDVIITREHIGVTFHVGAVGRQGVLDRALARAASHVDGPRARPVHVVRVRYDGADLAKSASALGLAVSELVRRHEQGVYEVLLVGFLPGFAYLGELDPALALPRMATPRARVPAGSVAIADRMTAVYPFASPGGWHLLGTAIDFVPFAFALGDRVRFEAQ